LGGVILKSLLATSSAPILCTAVSVQVTAGLLPDQATATHQAAPVTVFQSNLDKPLVSVGGPGTKIAKPSAAKICLQKLMAEGRIKKAAIKDKGPAASTMGWGFDSNGWITPDYCLPENDSWVTTEFEWWSGGETYDISFGAVIPRWPVVEVTGRRPDETLICINGSCSLYSGFEFLSTPDTIGVWGTAVGWFGDLFKPDLPNPIINTCVPRGTQFTTDDERHPRNTTSLSDDDVRQESGADIINKNQAHLNIVTTTKIDITWSDGGTETFQYVTANPRAHFPIPGSLKKGNGVSKCPP
jgi:hypothetical protein